MGLEVKGKVSLDGSGVEKTLSGLSGKIAGLLTGAFTVAAIGAGVKSLISYSRELVQMAEEFGGTAEDWAAADAWARRYGKSLQDVSGIMDKLQEARLKALGGDENALRNFRMVGMNEGALRGSKNIVRDYFQIQVTSAEQQMGQAGIFGDRLQSTVKLFRDFLADTDRYKNMLKATGQIARKSEYETLSSFSRLMDTLKLRLMNAFIPLLSAIIERWLPSVRRWMDGIQAWASVFLTLWRAQAQFQQEFPPLFKVLLYALKDAFGEFIDFVSKKLWESISGSRATLPKNAGDVIDAIVARVFGKEIKERTTQTVLGDTGAWRKLGGVSASMGHTALAGIQGLAGVLTLPFNRKLGEQFFGSAKDYWGKGGQWMGWGLGTREVPLQPKAMSHWDALVQGFGPLFKGMRALAASRMSTMDTLREEEMRRMQQNFHKDFGANPLGEVTYQGKLQPRKLNYMQEVGAYAGDSALRFLEMARQQLNVEQRQLGVLDKIKINTDPKRIRDATFDASGFA